MFVKKKVLGTNVPLTPVLAGRKPLSALKAEKTSGKTMTSQNSPASPPRPSRSPCWARGAFFSFLAQQTGSSLSWALAAESGCVRVCDPQEAHQPARTTLLDSLSSLSPVFTGFFYLCVSPIVN